MSQIMKCQYIFFIRKPVIRRIRLNSFNPNPGEFGLYLLFRERDEAEEERERERK